MVLNWGGGYSNWPRRRLRVRRTTGGAKFGGTAVLRSVMSCGPSLGDQYFEEFNPYRVFSVHMVVMEHRFVYSNGLRYIGVLFICFFGFRCLRWGIPGVVWVPSGEGMPTMGGWCVDAVATVVVGPHTTHECLSCSELQHSVVRYTA